MTVRNYQLWIAVVLLTAACDVNSGRAPFMDIDAVTVRPEPVMLGPNGRGVLAELPPVPSERRLAHRKPPLPAVRPEGIGATVSDAIDGEASDRNTAEPDARSLELALTDELSQHAFNGDDPSDVVGEPLFEPKKFFGMSADGVRTLLGPPQMVYERPPSTVWHYRDGQCELDLYFYLDVASGVFRVATFDLVPHDEDAALRRDSGFQTHCLKRLRMAYNAP